MITTFDTVVRLGRFGIFGHFNLLVFSSNNLQLEGQISGNWVSPTQEKDWAPKEEDDYEMVMRHVYNYDYDED
jgi:hypothetical protein